MPCKPSEAVSFNFIEPFPLCPLTTIVRRWPRKSSDLGSLRKELSLYL